jgi:hypothetical protein
MKIRGFLAILILTAAVVYFLWVAKAGKDKVVDDVKAFSGAKVQLTKTNMSSLAREVHSYIAMQGEYPRNLKELQEFRRLPLSTKDAWGTIIEYKKLSGDSFRLISAGPDRAFGTEDDISKDY